VREQYCITITDYRGARHYTLSQLMRRMLAGAVALLVVILLGGSLVISSLSNKVSQLMGRIGELQDQQAAIERYNGQLLAEQEHLVAELNRTEAIKRYNEQLLDEQERLIAEVNHKAEELSELSDELGHLEIMVGLRPEPEQTLAQRLDTASQTVIEKRLMLTFLPSGYPLRETQVTSGFGMRHHPIHDRTALHGGVDMRAARGTPVYATADGVVEWASHHKNSGLGKMVRLGHNYGFSTIYGHLDEIGVKVGDYVRQGDLLGLSGNTGMSTAPHLHYEVHYLSRRLDPKPFLEWSIENYDVLFSSEERVQWESLAEIIRGAVNGPERRWSQAEPALSAMSN
jgi:murein DD-endopeptidase MepM/ murein hydrolase activator NlpD